MFPVLSGNSNYFSAIYVSSVLLSVYMFAHIPIPVCLLVLAGMHTYEAFYVGSEFLESLVIRAHAEAVYHVSYIPSSVLIQSPKYTF